MPKYVKFMKEILSNKRKMGEYETAALTEECSAILQRMLQQKIRDPGSFTIPCTIGEFECKHVLCDLRASINLMPLSVFRRLGLGEARPTTMTLQLVDRSVKHPRGIIEDVLVKVDMFIFLADFIVLDMEEDENVSIIMGKQFVATRQALIDVKKGELHLRVQENLCYVYLGEKETLPVIVSTSLTEVEVEKLLRVLRVHKTAIGWTLADIKGISPSTMMHRILMEDDAKPTINA
ncbi:uncharacterized protein LOC133806894 [Humulus lupulus]|uniref:uncharacterized protein LOC133806894 n=1 Tax=Humulus lupulus TaxID=3486 RepID=UPI002B40D3A6|nr:uncharacterized protein LOC133806894 [Humulus lupulus]